MPARDITSGCCSARLQCKPLWKGAMVCGCGVILMQNASVSCWDGRHNGRVPWCQAVVQDSMALRGGAKNDGRGRSATLGSDTRCQGAGEPGCDVRHDLVQESKPGCWDEV